jgi:PhnB protein
MIVDDVDAAFARAIEAGAKEIMPVADQFWGDRYGVLEDPFGHSWSLSTPSKKQLSPEEIRENMKKMMPA